MKEVPLFIGIRHTLITEGVIAMAERKNSEARIRANNKYNAKAYDRINIAVPKGQKDIIQAQATTQGKSVNAYVIEAISEKIARDKAVFSGDGISESPVPSKDAEGPQEDTE